MSTVEFKLPDLGEGIESGTVVKLLITEGDVIAADQSVAEVEIDKATIELPCPHAGKVSGLAIAEGDQVSVGATLFNVDTSAAGAAPAAPPKAAPAKAAAPPKAAPAAPAKAAPAAAPRPSAAMTATAQRSYPAGPAVRRLARMLGVQLGQVAGSGQRGRITADDVNGFVKRLGGGNGTGGAALAPPPLPDFSAYGPVEVLPISSIRRRTAEHMARCWSIVPHVTHHDHADITELEAGRKAFKEANKGGPKITMTVVIAKACAMALKAFPDVNSSLDLAGGQQVFKQHYHLGVAVDTDYGLLVPVLRDVDKKPILQLAAELTDLASRARDKKLLPQEMRGGTFTISNLGGIGGRSFTPVVNWPEVAILGISRSRQEYQVTPAGPRPRLMMPMSLSYDHRLIDGAQAARFVRYLGWLLSKPTNLLFSA